MRRPVCDSSIFLAAINPTLTATGNFIYQNYRQALEKIAINSGQLALLESSLGTTAADYEAYHAAEVQYFQDLRSEPDDIQQTVDYIEKLQKHAEAS